MTLNKSSTNFSILSVLVCIVFVEDSIVFVDYRPIRNGKKMSFSSATEILVSLVI